jgi:LPXTG-site transpeptidase (sortase) family protein
VAKKPFSRKILVNLLILGGVILLTFSGLLFLDIFRTTQTGERIPSAEVITTEGTVSERDPGPVDDQYTVASTNPRRIDIPSIGVSAYVQPVGVLDNGDMATPRNLFFTGWYVNSVSPGDVGLSIINGHSGGRYHQGVFRALGKLKENDNISVQLGNLEWIEFAVVSVESYTLTEAARVLHQPPTETNELRLITCDGIFNDTYQTYDRRFIVVAKRIS